jgi:hypothetical protein
VNATNPQLRQVGESHKDYAERMYGWARAAETDRDTAIAQQRHYMTLANTLGQYLGDVLAALDLSYEAEPSAALAKIQQLKDRTGTR